MNKRKTKKENASSFLHVYDFDKTITKRDSFTLFLKFLFGKRLYYTKLLSMYKDAIKYCLGKISRDELKARLIKKFLTNVPEELVINKAELFCKKYADKLLIPDAVTSIAGARTFVKEITICSASPEIMLLPLANMLNIKLIGTRLEVKHGVLTGLIVGKNCRAEEKVVRLKEKFGELTDYTLHVWGDSPGDYDMMRIANKCHWRPFRMIEHKTPDFERKIKKRTIVTKKGIVRERRLFDTLRNFILQASILSVTALLLFCFYHTLSYTANASIKRNNQNVVDLNQNKQSLKDAAFLMELNKNLPNYYANTLATTIIDIEGSPLRIIKTNSGSTLYSDGSPEHIIVRERSGGLAMIDISNRKTTNMTSDSLVPYNLLLMRETMEGQFGALLKADNEQFRVYIFIDPACGFCHKISADSDSYLSKGISIEYLPFPIFGARSEEIFFRVWSLPPELRADALDKAQNYLIKHPKSKDVDAIGLPVATKEGISLVENYKQIARNLGFSGTPGIFLQNGELVKGYVSSDKLFEILNN